MNKKVVVVVVLLLLAITLLIIDIVNIRNKRTQCLVNPLIYGAKLWSEENDAEFYCVCRFQKPSSAVITFDKNNLTIRR